MKTEKIKERSLRYRDILERRSILPRRDTLTEMIKRQRALKEKLDEEYARASEEIQQRADFLTSQLHCYFYSNSQLSLLARAEEAVTRESGVYVVKVNDSPVYVGESQCMQDRVLVHARAIINATTGAGLDEMYKRLHVVSDYDQISFAVLEVVPDYKNMRLDAEGKYCDLFIEHGHALFNKQWKTSKNHSFLQKRSPVDLDLKQLIAEEELAMGYNSKGTALISPSKFLELRKTMALELILEHYKVDDEVEEFQ